MKPEKRKSITPEQAAKILAEHDFVPNLESLNEIKDIMLCEHDRYYPTRRNDLVAHFQQTEVVITNAQDGAVLKIKYPDIKAMGQVNPDRWFITYKKKIRWTLAVDIPSRVEIQRYFDWLELQ